MQLQFKDYKKRHVHTIYPLLVYTNNICFSSFTNKRNVISLLHYLCDVTLIFNLSSHQIQSYMIISIWKIQRISMPAKMPSLENFNTIRKIVAFFVAKPYFLLVCSAPTLQQTGCFILMLMNILLVIYG